MRGKCITIIIVCIVLLISMISAFKSETKNTWVSFNKEVKTIKNVECIDSFEKGPICSDRFLNDSILYVGVPASLLNVSETILYRKAYVVSYNQDTKNPNWVAWHLTSDHVDGPCPRINRFHEDEDVDMPRATLEDYRGSGWSRGHMCPAGDNKWDEEAMYQSFSLTNVCPQNASLNSGLWNSIEKNCRQWAQEYGDIYIVCGPMYINKKHELIGPNNVVVPEAFFKVVLCLSGVPKAFGFVVRNTDGNRKRDLFYNSIDEVERITGLDFFPSLPDKLENEVEAKANMDSW